MIKYYFSFLLNMDIKKHKDDVVISTLLNKSWLFLLLNSTSKKEIMHVSIVS